MSQVWLGQSNAPTRVFTGSRFGALSYCSFLLCVWRLSQALAPIGAYRRLTIAPIDSGAYPAPIVGAYRRLAPIKYFHRHFLCIHRMSAQQPAQRKATVRGAYQAPIDR